LQTLHQLKPFDYAAKFIAAGVPLTPETYWCRSTSQSTLRLLATLYVVTPRFPARYAWRSKQNPIASHLSCLLAKLYFICWSLAGAQHSDDPTTELEWN